MDENKAVIEYATHEKKLSGQKEFWIFAIARWAIKA